MDRAAALATLDRLGRRMGIHMERADRERARRLYAEALEVVERGERAVSLREAIRRLKELAPALTAKQIPPLLDLAALGMRNPPSVRTVQRHLNALRQAPCRK